MPLTPSPSPVDVYLHTGAAEWWQIVPPAAIATLLAAVIAGAIAWRALNERSIADRRSEWWVRTQWALEASLSDNSRRAKLGLGVMDLQAKSALATQEELSILDVAWEKPVKEAEEARDAEKARGNEESLDVDGAPSVSHGVEDVIKLVDGDLADGKNG